MESPQSGRRSERLERTIQNEIVPRLMLSHRAGPISPTLAAAVSSKLTEADVAKFVDAVRGSDDGRAHAYVRELVANGTPIESVYLDLLAPTAWRIGDLWDSDECDFVEVTLAMGRMQGLLRELSQVFLADSSRAETVGSVLLTCVPGEQHTLGVIMVGEFLLRDGWRVLVGAPWTENDLLEMVEAEWYDVIGFSVGCEGRIASLKREIRRLPRAVAQPERASDGRRKGVQRRSGIGGTGGCRYRGVGCASGPTSRPLLEGIVPRIGAGIRAAGGDRRSWRAP